MGKRILWIVVALALVAIVWAMARPRSVPVDLALIERGPLRSFVEEEGKTRVVDRFVVAAPVAGRMERVTLDEGDEVRKGQVVARTDPLALKGQVEQAAAQIRALKERIAGADTLPPKPAELEGARVKEAQASIALDQARQEVLDAEAGFEEARKEAERAQSLVETASATEAEVDRAEATEIQYRARLEGARLRLKVAELQIRAAALGRKVLEARLKDFEWQKRDFAEQIAGIEATLPALRDDLARTEILAPADGVVLNLFQESERTLVAGTPILEIGDLATMEVEAEFLSEDAAHMKPGMPVEIFGRALGGEVVRATIKRIYPSAFEKISSLGVEQQRVLVIADFDNDAFRLGDGYRVEVRVLLEERENVLRVPEGALFRQGGKWQLFIVEADRAKLVEVETGIRDGRHRELLDGIEEGTRVILHPGDAVTDAARIEPLPGSMK
jgi:HlyD family secretion protein